MYYINKKMSDTEETVTVVDEPVVSAPEETEVSEPAITEVVEDVVSEETSAPVEEASEAPSAPVEEPSAPSTEEVVENVKEILTTEPVASSDTTELEERVKVLEERLEKLIDILKTHKIWKPYLARNELINNNM